MKHCLLQLTSAEQELTRLRELCSDQQTAIDELHAQLQGTLDEYGTLAYQCRVVSYLLAYHLPL